MYLNVDKKRPRPLEIHMHAWANCNSTRIFRARGVGPEAENVYEYPASTPADRRCGYQDLSDSRNTWMRANISRGKRLMVALERIIEPSEICLDG